MSPSRSKKGETVGIVGHNGSGKSTLLQMICGTLTPTSGSVQTHGRIAALLELGSGFNPEFTGRENVYLNAAVLGLSKAEIDARFDDIAAFADIGEFLDQPVKTYASGMYVRLAFAVQACIMGGLGLELSDKEYQMTKDRLDKYRVVMDSMTAAELEDPKIITASRIKRRSRGSGATPDVVRELLKSHQAMQKAIKGMRGGVGKMNMKRLLKRFSPGMKTPEM